MTGAVHRREICSTAVESDAPLDDETCEALKRDMADVISSVERWDLKVETISVTGLVDSADEITISAMPESQYMAPAGERTLSDFKPSTIRKCPECRCLWHSGKVHPDSDCPFGIVDGVMST